MGCARVVGGVMGSVMGGVMGMACALSAAVAQQSPPTTGMKPAPNAQRSEPAGRPAARAKPTKHPMIVEVLYSVPTGMDGDANRDGVRNATGDEFVEVVNPNDTSVQLLGYTLADESQGEKSKIRFTFPALELKSGEAVVVFNGYGASWSGPVGDSKAAPSKKHADFSNAYVFTMRVANNRAAFNNTGDSLTLFDPAGKAVQRVRWGTSAASTALEGVLDESVPDASRGSVQRVGVNPGDAWRPHTEFAQTSFSPGRYELDIAALPVPEAPAPAGQTDTTSPTSVDSKRPSK